MSPVAVAALAAAVVVFPVNRERSRLRGTGLLPARRLRQLLRSTWIWPAAAVAAVSLAASVFGPVGGALGALACAAAAWMHRRGNRDEERSDPLLLAAGWELLAAGLRAGLPASALLETASAEITGPARALLGEVADHLALGADPVAAWEPALQHPDTAPLARAARRTARTGSALAEAAEELAADIRRKAEEQAQRKAQRAAVWISMPLGLCFLPAFLCLGILPAVSGIAQKLSVIW